MGVRWTPLQSRSTERVGRRDRCKARGNPPLVIAKPCKRLWQSVFPFRVLRILSRFTLRMTHRLDIVSAVMCAAIRSFLVLRIFSSGALGIKKRGGYIAVSFFIIHQDCKYRLGFRVSPLYNRVRC